MQKQKLMWFRVGLLVVGTCQLPAAVLQVTGREFDDEPKPHNFLFTGLMAEKYL